MSDRDMGNIVTESESNPVTAHEIFNNIILQSDMVTL
jgi:hypothetical protein